MRRACRCWRGRLPRWHAPSGQGMWCAGCGRTRWHCWRGEAPGPGVDQATGGFDHFVPGVGSGRGGGDGGGGVERVDWGLADEEAEDLAERAPRHVDPVPGGVGIAVLLLVECLSAAGFFLHQHADVAAETGDELEQLVPEGAVAKAGDDGEIEADVDDGAADGAAARLALEVLQGWHEEFGIVRAGGAGWAGRAPVGGERLGGRWLLGFGGG